MNAIPHIHKSFLLNPLFKPLLLYQIQAGVANLYEQSPVNRGLLKRKGLKIGFYGDILSFRGSWVQIPPPASLFS
ncbi:MAG: hypothetical protein CMO11_00700 [Thaumarchaeota archaeon]|nr:hypothetical protein [Nitrososphaerota archaeon]